MLTEDQHGHSVDHVPSATPIPEDVLRRRLILGERIRLAREAADLSQERLGERVGLTRVSISNIETGVHSLVVDRLMMISNVVGVALGELLRD